MSARDPAVTWPMRVRRSVPPSVAEAVVRLRAWRARRNPASVEQARREMRHLIGAVRPDDVDRAADAYLYWHAWRSEMRYHPSVTTRQQVDGLSRLTAARGRGRGVLLTFLHHGQYEAAMASVARLGEPMTLLVDPMMLPDDAPVFLRQHVRVARMFGNQTASTAIGSAGVLARLGAGEVVAVAADVPSRTPVQFLGQDRLGSGGIARLSRAAECPVVSLTAHCTDGNLHLRLLDAVEPRDFDDVPELLQHLLARHEPAVLDWPEGYHQPLLRWGSPAQD